MHPAPAPAATLVQMGLLAALVRIRFSPRVCGVRWGRHFSTPCPTLLICRAEMHLPFSVPEDQWHS